MICVTFYYRMCFTDYFVLVFGFLHFHYDVCNYGFVSVQFGVYYTY